jgi:threonyl-tRNA synthetase
VTIIPVDNNQNDYVDEIYNLLKKENIYVNVDDRNERMSKKIREAQIMKTKIQMVIGNDEVKENKLSLRFYGSDQKETIDKKDIIKYLKALYLEK